MRNRFVVFDVETPNHNNDRISAIGITVVENGAVTESVSTLVDPEVHFDGFNIQLTGITPEMVAGKPNFSGLWEEIGEMMGSGLLIANFPSTREVFYCVNNLHRKTDLCAIHRPVLTVLQTLEV